MRLRGGRSAIAAAGGLTRDIAHSGRRPLPLLAASAAPQACRSRRAPTPPSGHRVLPAEASGRLARRVVTLRRRPRCPPPQPHGVAPHQCCAPHPRCHRGVHRNHPAMLHRHSPCSNGGADGCCCRRPLCGPSRQRKVSFVCAAVYAFRTAATGSGCPARSRRAARYRGLGRSGRGWRGRPDSVPRGSDPPSCVCYSSLSGDRLQYLSTVGFPVCFYV